MTRCKIMELYILPDEKCIYNIHTKIQAMDIDDRISESWKMDRYGKQMTENTLENQVYRFIIEQNLLKAGDACIVGVSGGADSICLLTVLAGLQEKMKLKLYAVHVNHMIRGTEADADEAYVEAYCKGLGIPCDSYHIDVPQLAKEQKLAEEEAGRNARYDAFARTADKYGITDYKVAVAHNKNDVAETVLLNMVRGTGIAGMAGIPVKRDRIVRPLLSCTRTEIEAYLEQKGIQYCTDSTNLENDYARNKIRNQVLPALSDVNAQAAVHISQVASYATMYDAYVTKQTEHFLDAHMEIRKQTGKGVAYVLEIGKLREQDELIEDLAILELIGRVSGGRKDIGQNHVREVKKLYQSAAGSRIMLPHGGMVYQNYGYLYFETATGKECNADWQETVIEGAGEYILPGMGRMKIEIFEKTVHLDLTKKEYTKFADYDRIQNGITIRKYMENDYMVITADGSTKKINRLFSSCKIPVAERSQIPLVASGHDIIWAVGVRLSEKYKVQPDTKRVICLEYTPEGENEDERADQSHDI